MFAMFLLNNAHSYSDLLSGLKFAPQDVCFQGLQPSAHPQLPLLSESKVCLAPIQIDSPFLQLLARKSSVFLLVTEARWLPWFLLHSSSDATHVHWSWLKMKHLSPSFTHPFSHSETQFSQSDDSTGKQCLIHSMLHRHTSHSYYRDLWDKEEGEFANSACLCPVSNCRWHDWLT